MNTEWHFDTRTVSTLNSLYPTANYLIFPCLNFLLSKVKHNDQFLHSSMIYDSFTDICGIGFRRPDGTQPNQILCLSSQSPGEAFRDLRDLELLLEGSSPVFCISWPLLPPVILIHMSSLPFCNTREYVPKNSYLSTRVGLPYTEILNFRSLTICWEFTADLRV